MMNFDSDMSPAIPGEEVVMTTLDKLPPMLGTLGLGTFAGITTTRSGEHMAVMVLPGRINSDWQSAATWARSMGGELPSRAVAAMVYANMNSSFERKCHWTGEEYDATYACVCGFDNGNQMSILKKDLCLAFAVRLIPLV